MSRTDVWIQYQRTVIDGGVAVSVIALEGPDNEVLQTWPIAYAALDQAIEAELASQREQLPKGRHQLRLVARDSGGAQCAQMLVTVTGSSTVQSEQANGRLMQERANALQLANVEKIQALSRSAHEFTAEVFESMRQGIRDRDEEIARLQELTHKQQLDLIREAGQQERLNALAAKFAPTLEMGVAVVGEFVAEWIDKRQSLLMKAKAPAATGEQKTETPGNQPASASEATGEQRTETADDQPASASPAGGNTRAEEPKADGAGRNPGNGDGDAVRARETKRTPNRRKGT